MKKYAGRYGVALIAVAGFLHCAAFADLGLNQIAAEQGAQAVGQAVLAAAQAVYAENTDPAVIQSKLIEILDEAAATGDEDAVRYAIVAVMMAGGAENIGLSQAAVGGSTVSSSFGGLADGTVSEMTALMSAGGGSPDGAGGGDSGGGIRDLPLLIQQIDPNDPFAPGSLTGGQDGDLPATPI